MAGETFNWRCPTCAKLYKLKVGKKAPKECPRCVEANEARLQAEFAAAVGSPPEPEPTYDVVHAPEPVIDMGAFVETPALPPKRTVVVTDFLPPRPRRGRLWPKLTFWISTPIVSAFAVWWTWWHPPQFVMYYVTYVAAAAISVWAGSFAWGANWKRRLLAISVAVVSYVAVYMLIQQHASYRMRQFLDDRTVTTSYHRNGQPYFQVIELPRAPGEVESRGKGWGPLSKNGLFHGLCTVQVRDSDGTISTRYLWRWEGQEVTEQEWKLRDEGR